MKTTRRNFFKFATVLGLAPGAINWALSPNNAYAANEPVGALSQHTLPPLSYAFDALEPYIDSETMETHYSKHHQSYVNGLNKAEKELGIARAKGDYSMVQHWSRKAAFCGGGHFLHSMFWSIMAPKSKGSGGEPSGDLLKMIQRDFGSFQAFKDQFSEAAASVEGSGWGLLHLRPLDSRLIILQAENQHKLSPWGTTPVLGIDVWEHAYYLKYRNRRKDYITAWWNVVNWQQVALNIRLASSNK
jgi:Fe-Mn family superoxide dismutase